MTVNAGLVGNFKIYMGLIPGLSIVTTQTKLSISQIISVVFPAMTDIAITVNKGGMARIPD